MAITRNQKVQILEELQSGASVQPTVVLLTTNESVKSLDSTATTDIRQNARKSGVKIKVVKNTLIRRSFKSVPKLTGPTYVAYLVNSKNADEVTVPKAVVDVVSDYKNQISVFGSVVNGEFYSAQQTVQLSKVPSFTDSMAMVAGSLNALTAKIARTIQEVPSSVARGVSEYSKTLS